MADSYFSQVFNQVSNPNRSSSSGVPMLNTLHRSLSNYITSAGQISKKKALMAWFKSIPELTGLASKVARDVVYKFRFEPYGNGSAGRNRIQEAERFSLVVGMRSIMLSQMIDMLATGEAYGWTGRIDKSIIKQIASDLLIRRKTNADVFLEAKSELFRSIDKETKAMINSIDEDIKRPRLYRYVASSSMENLYDNHDVYAYKQIVGTDEEKFSPEEIIRFTQLGVDGKPNGFTPVESIVVQLELLRQMWQNNLSVHTNGGHPDKIFVLKNERIGTPSYKKIEETLMKYRKVENKHGHMLFTGDIDVIDLQKIDDMFFSNLGLYVTGVMAMQWQVPKSSIPFIVGGTNTKDDTGGNSERGYWHNVEMMQEQFAETMNTQLWIPYFGVKIVFENSFPHQNVQIQQANNMRLNNIKLMDEILSKMGKQLSDDKRLKELGFTSEDVVDIQNDSEPIGFGSNNQMPIAQTLESSGNVNRRNAKRDEQSSSTKPDPLGV